MQEKEKYVVTFENNTGHQGCLPDTMYFTKQGLDFFLAKFESEFKKEEPNVNFDIFKNTIEIDGGDFVICINRYEKPKEPEFKNEIPNRMYISFENLGHEATCFDIDMYD